MEERIVEFIAALRAAGVRISIAESEDAFRAAQQMGVRDQYEFRDALRATLVKEARDRATFDEMFPLYFGSGGPPLGDLTADLSPQERQQLAQALGALLQHLRQAARQAGERGEMDPGRARVSVDNLMQLLQQLLQGLNPTPEQMDAAARQAQLGWLGDADNYQQRLAQQRLMREMGMQVLHELLEALAQLLAEAGMSQRTIQRLLAGIEANRQSLAERIARYLGVSAARQRTEAHPGRRQDVSDLMQRPFQDLDEREAEVLREQVRRLAAQLRSRAALRRRRGKRGSLDVKRIMRANLRYGGVPLELKLKTRHLKPKLLLICDISTSMRPVVEFLLRLIYELQDQVASARSFAFIDDLSDISPDFSQHTPRVAIEAVLTRLPPGHYNTDLGHSLDTLMSHHAGAVDPRTTVIFVGDARNNYNDPRLDLMERVQRRARRVIWLNPEPRHLWGSGDSDMPAYLPYADAVHRVGTLAELAAAVDKLLT
ncbi:MAG: VWA domain-containing protein [Anaerolineae bacterium]